MLVILQSLNRPSSHIRIVADCHASGLEPSERASERLRLAVSEKL